MFLKQYYGFPSQSKFENFERILDLKCKTGKIKILDSKSEVESGLIDFRMYYQCITCKEKFVMSIPDNAWRGYFLTERNAIEYYEKIKHQTTRKKMASLSFYF